MAHLHWFPRGRDTDEGRESPTFRDIFQQAWWLMLVKSGVLLGVYAFRVTLSLLGAVMLTIGSR